MGISARRATIFLALLFGFASLLASQAGAWSKETPSGEAVVAESGKSHAAERLVVTFEPGVTEAAESEAIEQVAGEVEGDIQGVEAEVVSLPGTADSPVGEAGEDLRLAREDLEDEPGVAAVDYDYLREVSYVPADPAFSGQWSLKKTDFREAWDAARGGGARIAVVDSGIDAGHADLRGKILSQKDFVNDDPVADDALGHGTHVAGIAAAATGNGAGISGGCPDCGLLIAKTMQGNIGYDSDVAAGIVWAADNGADVINLSLSGPASSDILARAVDYAHNKGSVVVAAAGNGGNGVVQYPAAYPDAIAVSATDASDNRASFSTHGGWVDVSAPGVGVMSTVPGGYAPMSGTSMASPHVAALAGLLAGQGLTNEQIKRRILSNTDDRGPSGRDRYYGTGRINAAEAVGGSNTEPPAEERNQDNASPPVAPPASPPEADESGGERTLASDETRPPRAPEQAQEPPPSPPPAPAAKDVPKEDVPKVVPKEVVPKEVVPKEVVPKEPPAVNPIGGRVPQAPKEADREPPRQAAAPYHIDLPDDGGFEDESQQAAAEPAPPVPAEDECGTATHAARSTESSRPESDDGTSPTSASVPNALGTAVTEGVGLSVVSPLPLNFVLVETGVYALREVLEAIGQLFSSAEAQGNGKGPGPCEHLEQGAGATG